MPATAPSPRRLHLLVFSKDRACQLDALLRSIRDHLRVACASLSVLYRASDDAYAAAYRLCIGRRILDDIRWLREADFCADLRLYLDALPQSDLLMPLVDDDMLYRPFGDQDILGHFSDRHLFISLRCSRRYPTHTPPAFLRSESFLEWPWNYGRRRRLVWNYPFSIDGNIFHVSHFRRAAGAVEFQAPNSLEGRLHRYRHAGWVKRIALALAPRESVLVNNPLNRVQVEGETWHQGLDPAAFNRRYLEGCVLDNEIAYAQQPAGVHSPLTVAFRDSRGRRLPADRA